MRGDKAAPSSRIGGVSLRDLKVRMLLHERSNKRGENKELGEREGADWRTDKVLRAVRTSHRLMQGGHLPELLASFKRLLRS